MLVYHGSNTPVNDPQCDYNERDDLDFGYGFYVTVNADEAASWAKSKRAERLSNDAYITEFELDDAYISECLSFDEPDDDWFDFLDVCRCSNPYYKIDKYPIVEGEVADDQGAEIFDDYHSGEITRGYALDQLSSMELGYQICLRTDEAINDYLKYLRSYRIK